MTASPLAQKATDAFNAPICETDPEIADEVGAKFWVDMAHFAGLVAA